MNRQWTRDELADQWTLARNELELVAGDLARLAIADAQAAYADAMARFPL